MNIRVLQVAKFFPPDPGGIETTTKDIFEVDGGGYISDALCFSQLSKTKTEYRPTGKVIRSGTLFTFASMPVSFSYFYHFKKIRNSYDIIHLHHPNPVGVICLLLFKCKGKVIIHWHSDILNKGLFYKLFAPFERALLKKADKIVCTSPIYITGSPVLKNFIIKCTFIPSAFTEASLAFDALQVNLIKEKYNGKKIIFTLGRHVGYKGFNYLIKAAKYLSNDAVVLIGGTGPLYSFHEKLIKDLQLEDKVFLLGRIENENLGSYYKACEVFCLPSCHKSEAFGLVMIEAMCFSKPVVATKIPQSGVSWVNQNEVTGLNAENENPISLAEKISVLLNNESLAAEYGRNGNNRYKEFFTEKKLRASFATLYRSLLQNEQTQMGK